MLEMSLWRTEKIVKIATRKRQGLMYEVTNLTYIGYNNQYNRWILTEHVSTDLVTAIKRRASWDAELGMQQGHST
jgi:hypothetical protein